MNTTIRFLFLQQLSTSPFVVSSAVAISNSRISNGFTSFAFNTKYFQAFSSTFFNFLRAPVYIDKENRFKGLFFERPLKQPINDNSLQIIDSGFYNCINTDRDGGAIYFESLQERAFLYHSVFHNCRSISKNGGAFYLEVKSAKINFVCGSQCFAAEEGQFFFLCLKRFSEINYTCSIDSSTLKTIQQDQKINRGGVCIQNGKQFLNFFNSTRNSVHGESASLSLNSKAQVSVTFSHFENNQGLSVIDLLAIESGLDTINFVNNSGKFAMIQFNNLLNLKNSKFIFNQNYIRPFSVLLDDGKARIYNSFFNIPRIDLDKIIFRNCSFDIEEIQTFIFSQCSFTINPPQKDTNITHIAATESIKISQEIEKKHFDIEEEKERKEEDVNKSHQEKGIEDCPGPNTIRSDGKCQCLHGYPFGEPDQPDGCWRCLNSCHKNAVCASPGKCVCAEGYIGDGIIECALPVPRLKSINPQKVKKSYLETITLIYETDENTKALQIFCRIGTVYSVGEIIGSEQAMCVVPKSDVAALKVSMSFDNQTWSEENVYLMFTDIDSNKRGGIVVVRQVWVLFAIAAIAAFAYLKLRRNKTNTEVKMEVASIAEREAFNPSRPRIGADSIEETIDL